MVNEAIAVNAREAAEEAKDIALETLQEVREKVLELRPDTKKQKRQRRRKRRSFGLFVLAVVGLAVVAVYLKRRRDAQDYGPSSDAFGAAIVEEQHASDAGRRPVATPGV